MKALILRPSQRITVVEEMDIPKPHEGEVLIQVHAVALNPVDEFYITNPVATQERRIVGSDFSGIVVGASPELSDMADLRVKQGTRVAGFLQGGPLIIIIYWHLAVLRLMDHFSQPHLQMIARGHLQNTLHVHTIYYGLLWTKSLWKRHLPSACVD